LAVPSLPPSYRRLPLFLPAFLPPRSSTTTNTSNTSNTSNSNNSNNNNNMVATRRSLGGQATPVPSSSPPAAASSQLTRAQQAALKKLDIAGTDALKGDAKAAQAARDQVQTYHYRGAVYAADANTSPAWIENQPKRYLKRSRDDSAGDESKGEGSIAAEGDGEDGEEEDNDDDEDEDEDEDETPARPAKRRRTMPSSRAKPRAGRGGSRSSLPTKRTADPPRDNNTATPTKKSPIPNKETMDEEIARLKEEAKKKNYNVEKLSREDIMAGARSRTHSQFVKLAREQKKLRGLILEWNQAKELLEAKQREAGVKLLEHVEAEVEDAPMRTNYQSCIELGQTDSDDDEEMKGNGDELNEQWQREQEQNRMDQQTRLEPEIPETSPAAQEMHTSETSPSVQKTTPDLQQLGFPGTSPAIQQTEEPSTANGHFKIADTPTFDQPVPTTESLPEAATAAGASRPETPNPATSSKPFLPPSAARATPPTHTAAHHHHTPSSSARASTKEPSTTPFSHLPPDAILPTIASDGNPLRWTLKRHSSVESPDFAIDIAKLQGESKSAKNRRIKRERGVAESWALKTGGRVVEENGMGGS